MSDGKITSPKAAEHRQARALEMLVEVREFAWDQISKFTTDPKESFSKFEAERHSRWVERWTRLEAAIHILDSGYDKQSVPVETPADE